MRPVIPDIAKFMMTVVTDCKDWTPEERLNLSRLPAIIKQIGGLIGCVQLPTSSRMAAGLRPDACTWVVCVCTFTVWAGGRKLWSPSRACAAPLLCACCQ
jgi:hypothetical protein